ncbi:MAG: ATP-grasp domain-containing protein, partial [Gammaproteobacteria bacterium]
VGRLGDLDEASAVASDLGYPVMIKAAAGGGGRGIRIARDSAEFKQLASQAATEAKAAFGDGGLYVEKLIDQARHIEVQVLGDGQRAVHCFERECSLQRRRQKVWEEAPSPALAPPVREGLCRAAVALTEAVGYSGAGTVEFLFDDATQEFYFIEMNTRIQVEHPVSECVTGIDLIEQMLRVAGDEPLAMSQSDISSRGHAIEVRINAEDPSNGFMPCPGQVDGLTIPGGPGVRFDHMLYDGAEVPPFYDSLLGKLIVWAETRPRALARLRRAVGELRIGGIQTTTPLFQALAIDDDVVAARYHTGWLENWLESPARDIGAT